MKHHLLGLLPDLTDLELMSTFDLDLLSSTCICFDASRRKQQDDVRFVILASFAQKLFAKNASVKTGYFDPLLPVNLKLLKLAQRNSYQI